MEIYQVFVKQVGKPAHSCNARPLQLAVQDCKSHKELLLRKVAFKLCKARPPKAINKQWYFRKQLILKYTSLKKKKLKYFNDRIGSNKRVVLKGVFGGMVDYQTIVSNQPAFQKYLLFFLKNLHKMTRLLINKIGVLGRGMYTWKLRRDLFYGHTSFLQKKGRKYNPQIILASNVKTKLKKEVQNIKVKTKLKKKKKVYTWQVRRNNKWYRFKHIFTGLVTQLGERGHALLPFSREFAVKFQRKNTIYKTIIMATKGYNNMQFRQNLDKFVEKRPFGPYKVKGLKRLGQRGLVKEGKARKF